MQPNEDGYCHSYYGTWNINDKPPTVGVVYFMLDEHVKSIIDKEKERFTREMSLVMKEFIDSLKDFNKKQEKEIKVLHYLITDLTKYMYKIVDVNELKEPVIEKKLKSKGDV